MKLVTPQTGPGGRIVQRLLIEEGLDIKRELYLSILVDRAVEAPVIMASTAGGMEIEEVAHKNPEPILRETILPASGLQPYHVRKLAFGLGLARRRGAGGGAVSAIALPRVPRNGRLARGDQSADRHRRRPADRARRQDEFRRQRALSPQGSRRAARP